MKNLILVLCIFSIFSCANIKKSNSKENYQANSKQDTTMNYEELAKQKLNFIEKTENKQDGKAEKLEEKAEEKFECIKNTDKSFVLCKKTIAGTVVQPRNSISFVVYNMKTNELVYEGYVDGGSVGWYDTNSLAIYQRHGNPREETTTADMTRIYDVVKKTNKRKSDIKK